MTLLFKGYNIQNIYIPTELNPKNPYTSKHHLKMFKNHKTTTNLTFHRLEVESDI